MSTTRKKKKCGENPMVLIE